MQKCNPEVIDHLLKRIICSWNVLRNVLCHLAEAHKEYERKLLRRLLSMRWSSWGAHWACVEAAVARPECTLKPLRHNQSIHGSSFVCTWSHMYMITYVHDHVRHVRPWSHTSRTCMITYVNDRIRTWSTLYKVIYIHGQWSIGHVQTWTCMHAQVCSCTCAWTYMYNEVHVRAWTYIYMYMYIYAHERVHERTCTCIIVNSHLRTKT